jgi:hypothetical protein
MEKRSAVGVVTVVSCSGVHGFSKPVHDSIRLLAGLGVEGDAHLGVTVKHRSRVAKDPTQPNLRQVHLIHEELHDELRAAGFLVAPGVMSENITTPGLDLLGLPRGHTHCAAQCVGGRRRVRSLSRPRSLERGI